MDNEKYISNSYGTRQLTFLLENNRAQLDWAYEYLKKKDPYIIQQKTMKDLKKIFIDSCIHRKLDKQTFERMVSNMEKAWKADVKRHASDKTMLNVSISKEHKSKFEYMALKKKCNNIQMLESLIDDNYKNFLRLKEQELIAKNAERTKKAEIKYNQSFTDKKLSGELHLQKNYNNRLKKQVTALKSELQAVKDNSSILFAIIEKAVKNRSKLTADHLMQATRAHTLIDIVQLPLDESMQATESEESTEQNQASGPRQRKRARPAKTASK
ncbi:hypothetical protein Sbal625DRAFT_3284 [Shewanella baltica OS625]|uniref:hypothetical protein n=1 Tax=Shewanella baltica TaxID=62322 RepID=UPI000230D235|nr:hypothetical protein [Shewanella baltica]EHC05151.1 hypothetical protein Sbal625DRAFT_3284 [Shewanella baltica OS625]